MEGYQWAVIGAGPAGIAAVGKLLDHGIPGNQISWIDPLFTVGDFGLRWKNIPSNTKVDLFQQFLRASDAFSYSTCDQDFVLNHISTDETCLLHHMVEPLQWVTTHLQTKVHVIKDVVTKLSFKAPSWNIYLKQKKTYAKNVVLAIGAEPKTLALTSCPLIPLQDAMDKDFIKNHLDADDVVAVFGSSHSAVLALKNLVNHPAKKIINFYRSPLIYAVYKNEEIVNDNTGLKGVTAEWAREHLHEALPLNLIRLESNGNNIRTYLPECTKVVYAIGFERRPISIEGLDIQYDHQTGMIAKGLFGCGIAFPEATMNTLGLIEYKVGLWKFMSYLQRVMPGWID